MRTIPLACSCVMLVFAAGNATGQLVACGSSVRVGGVGGLPTPDFDQRRDALPGDGGMYCGPTSFANLMGYYALRGYPELFPNCPFFYWSNYDDVTDNIATIGSLMGTSASGGTGDAGIFDGGLAWMEDRGGPPMNWSQLLGSNVTPQAMYRVLELGGTASIAYGRYSQNASDGSWSWTGGHVVTLDRVERLCPSPMLIFPWVVSYRDPATNEDPNDLDAQSIYATSERPSRQINITYRLGDGTNETRPSFEFLVAGDPTVRRVWYTMNALAPEQTMFRPFVLGTVWRFDPSIVFDGGPQQFDFDPGPVDDAAFGGEPGVAMVLRSEANGGLTPVRLAAWDGINDGLLAQVPLTGSEAFMCVGRQGQVHVFNNSVLRTFRFNSGDSPSFTELGTPRAVVQTAGTIVGIGFDDRDDRVLLLRSDAAVVRIGVDRLGVANGAMDTLGNGGAPAFATSGRKRIAQGTSATGGDYWIGPFEATTPGGADTLRRFTKSLVTAALTQSELLTPPLPPAGGPGTWTNATSIADWSIADRDRIVMQRGSQLQEVKRGVSIWVNVPSSPWFGRTARGAAVVSRSRNQIDRTEPLPTVWNLLSPDVVSTETPDCLPDVGRAGGLIGPDGLLDNNDFIAFITMFFNADPGADRGVAGGLFGHDGVFDNNDFIEFINEFFEGC